MVTLWPTAKQWNLMLTSLPHRWCMIFLKSTMRAGAIKNCKLPYRKAYPYPSYVWENAKRGERWRVQTWDKTNVEFGNHQRNIVKRFLYRHASPRQIPPQKSTATKSSNTKLTTLYLKTTTRQSWIIRCSHWHRRISKTYHISLSWRKKIRKCLFRISLLRRLRLTNVLNEPKRYCRRLYLRNISQTRNKRLYITSHKGRYAW